MKSKYAIIVGVAILVLLVATLPNLAYRQGFHDGKILGKLEARVLNPPTFDIPEYEPPMTDDERIQMLLEKFMVGIDSANISIEFDNSGYSKGFISIYYKGK